MTDEERYLFDLNGYLLIRDCLEPEILAIGQEWADMLEAVVADLINDPHEPEQVGHFNIRYRSSWSDGFHAYKMESGGLQYVVDDIEPQFSDICSNARTAAYVADLIEGPPRITSSELRYRYEGSYTPTHMGGPIDARNRYRWAGKFDLLNVRVLYALHDIHLEDGPLCVVPGSHKGNFNSPYDPNRPLDEPGMIPVEMRAGDAVLFTENLRHGGLPNRMKACRKTIHLMFSPEWVGSQSPVHWNKLP